MGPWRASGKAAEGGDRCHKGANTDGGLDILLASAARDQQVKKVTSLLAQGAKVCRDEQVEGATTKSGLRGNRCFVM